MKKLGIALGALVGLLIAAMIVIPLVVDVDKYRPQIVEAANESLNGHLELGHLHLSLWGHVRIEADGLSLKDAQGASVVSVKNASFFLPFFPLLTGSPVVDLEMDAPAVSVVKNRSGKLNLATLMKTAPQAPEQGTPGAPSAPAPAPTQAKPAAETPSVAVPAIVARARLGLQLLHANVRYKDETSGMVTEMRDLNFVAKSLSLSHPSELSLWSDFDTRMGQGAKALSVKGPGRIDLTFSPRISGGKLSQFTLSGKADFDSLEVSMPGSFQKNKGVAANVELLVSGSDQDVKIEKADINFFNAQVKSSGTISSLQTAPTIRYTLKSNDIALKDWVELLPSLKEYQLGGSANLAADLGGRTDKISYQAKIGVSGLTAKAPDLKAQPRVDAEINVATDQIQSLLLTMKAPGNDLKISGKMLSFTAPQLSLEVTSSGMDLDQLIDFQAMAAKTAKAWELVHSAFAETQSKAKADYDALLDPLRENKVLGATTANVSVNLKMLKAQNIRMNDIVGKIYLKNLAAGVENLNLQIFNGTVKTNLSSQLRPKSPTYKFSANIKGLDLGEAVKSQMAMFQNTLTGKANFDVVGEGASFNPEPAKANLKAKGSMKISDAQFSTLDVGKMVVDGIQSSISKIASKVPGLAGKSINPPNIKSKYQLVSSDFGISGGRFSAPNFVGKAIPNQGFDLKGTVQVGLKDQSLDAKFQIIDTYNMSHAKDVAGGVLLEKGKPFTIPVGAGCTLKQPCYSYGETAEFLAKVAANNAVGALKQQGLDQLKKALGGGNGHVPDVGGALKNLFGH